MQQQPNNPQSTYNTPPFYANPQPPYTGPYQPPIQGSPQYRGPVQYQPSNQGPQKSAPTINCIQAIFYLTGLIVCIILLIYMVLPNFHFGSTPEDTLTTYCNALKNHDYQTAYNQFSQKNSQFTSETDFASMMNNGEKLFGGLTDCSTGTPNENDSSGIANASIFLNYSNGTTLEGNVKLIRENETWKMQEMTFD